MANRKIQFQLLNSYNRCVLSRKSLTFKIYPTLIISFPKILRLSIYHPVYFEHNKKSIFRFVTTHENNVWRMRQHFMKVLVSFSMVHVFHRLSSALFCFALLAHRSPIISFAYYFYLLLFIRVRLYSKYAYSLRTPFRKISNRTYSYVQIWFSKWPDSSQTILYRNDYY